METAMDSTSISAADASRGEGAHAGEPVDIQRIVYDVCELEHGGCACKVKRINLARPEGMFGADPRGARCDERYTVALAVLCAICKAGGEPAAVEAVKRLATSFSPAPNVDAPPAEAATAATDGRVDVLTMVGPEADRLRRIASAIRDGRPGSSVRLTRLVDDVSTWTAVVPGLPPHEFDNRDDASEWASDAASLVQAKAVAAVLPPSTITDPLASIARWCEETFGPITIERLVARAAEEMDELRAEPHKADEVADVIINLSRYPGAWAAVQAKMEINRGRTWRLMGDGTGYHIKPDGSTSAPEADPLADLVSGFSVALLDKLRAAEAKYGHGDAWALPGWREDLCRQLAEHVAKGDPRDVAAYAAFAWHHGWSVSDAAALTSSMRSGVPAGVLAGLKEADRLLSAEVEYRRQKALDYLDGRGNARYDQAHYDSAVIRDALSRAMLAATPEPAAPSPPRHRAPGSTSRAQFGNS